jgi:hypothetical protein
MTAAAIIHGVTGRAGSAVYRCILAVDVVLPPRGVRSRHHHFVAGIALILSLPRRGHILVAHVALGVGIGGLLGVMDPKALGMERGLHVSNMTDRSIQTGGCIGMARGAVGHPELGRDDLGRIVTLHTIQHSGQREIRQTGASRDRVVTRGAIDLKLLLLLEVRDMGELNVDILPRHRYLGDHAAVFGKTRILNFFRRVATAAPLSV